MTFKTEVLNAEGKPVEKSIPSRIGLLTIAEVTMPEPDRLDAAKRWVLGAGNVFGPREEYLLRGFWDLLDNEPEGFPVTRIVPRYVSYRT